MFCPKCATQNLDGAHFCRSCGANISLVPQALTGQLAQPPMTEDSRSYRGKRRRELTLEQPVQNFFLGIAFVIISILLSRTIGQVWWFWMLIPAFSLMAKGVAQFIRLKDYQQRVGVAPPPPVNRSFVEPPPRTPEELRNPVGSVTEGTTRHLGVEAPTRHLDHERK